MWGSELIQKKKKKNTYPHSEFPQLHISWNEDMIFFQDVISDYCNSFQGVNRKKSFLTSHGK